MSKVYSKAPSGGLRCPNEFTAAGVSRKTSVKERPILMSAPMVRAILAGTKTQTRRTVKPQPIHPVATKDEGIWSDTQDPVTRYFGCPYGARGDRLYVKETSWFDTREPHDVVIYEATPSKHKYQLSSVVEDCDPQITIPYLEAHKFWKRRPSIFMRRCESRITLEITAVRVERVNDISENDAIAEGSLSVRSVEWDMMYFPDWRREFDSAVLAGTKPPIGPSPRILYRALWESINGAGSWAVNPWVWVIEFEPV
jgi:hypothetical protein